MLTNRKFGIIFPFIVIGWVILALGHDLLFQSALLMSSTKATAQVTKIGMEHNTCIYQFSASQQAYDGVGYECGRYEQGTEIKIYYLAQFPKISSNLYPGTGLILNFAVSAAAVLVCLIVGFIKRRQD